MPKAIRFENVTKRFTLHQYRPRSLKELALGLFQGDGWGRGREELIALDNVSFEVEQGETLGIIGPNGAGKSTILKLITHILEPTSGQIAVNGRLSALLELGAGFHPDLTGRENIYLNGSILGFSKREMDRRFEDIVAFSELERFIDTPVKYYSSGMQVRLGFAIAINVEPDILLVDEVLAVGDAAYQKKCLEKIREFIYGGVTILFVSHNLEIVKNICKKTLWLDKGVIRKLGSTEETVELYLDAVAREREQVLRDRHEKALPVYGDRVKSGVEIISVSFLDSQGRERFIFDTDEQVTARIRYVAYERVERPVFGVAIHRDDGIHINGPNTKAAGFDIDYIEGRGYVDYVMKKLPLLPGTYFFSVAIHDEPVTGVYDYHKRVYDYHERRYAFEVRPGPISARERYGILYIPSEWRHVREEL